MSAIDVPVGKKIMLAVKSLEQSGTVEIIRVECVEGADQNRCSECVFRHREECHIYECYSGFRKDGKDVYYKKFEVVDEELNLNNEIMNRKFDLDAAVNKGAKIRTRCGYPARIIATGLRGDFPVVAVVCGEESDDIISYTSTGQCYKDVESNYDLEMMPEKRYINIFQGEDGKYRCSKRSYPTVAMAKELEGFVPRKYKGSRYVATVEIDE